MKTFLAASLLLLLAGAPGRGADSGAAAPLSLDDCLRLAETGHPLMAAASAGVSSATEAVDEARAPYWPQVDLSAGYHRWQRRAFLPSGLSLPGHEIPELIGPLDDWNGGLASRLTLFDFGERRAGLDAARARLGGAQADLAATRADLRLAVESAFFGLADAQDLLGVAERNLARTESHRALAQARQEAGAVPRADVLRTEADVENARLQLISARSRVRLASGQLNTAMGRPAETPLAIAPPSAAPPPPDPADLETTVRQAVANRPELKSEQQRLEAARAGVDGARASRAPKVRADGSFGWNDTGFLPETKEWQLGLSVDLPVFDGGSRIHRLAHAQADLARAQAIYDNRVLQIRQEVWAAVTELQRAWESIAASEAGVRSSEESLRVVRERYENGAALISDLLDTQTVLARAEAALADARWTYLADRAAYDRAIASP